MTSLFLILSLCPSFRTSWYLMLCAFPAAFLHAFCTLKLLPQTVPKISLGWFCYQTLNNPPYGFSRNPHYLLSFWSPESRKLVSFIPFKYLRTRKNFYWIDCEGCYSAGTISAVSGSCLQILKCKISFNIVNYPWLQYADTQWP